MKKLIWMLLLTLALTLAAVACTQPPENPDTTPVTTEGEEPATPAPEVTTEGPEEPATPAPEVTTEGPEEPATPAPEVATEGPEEPATPAPEVTTEGPEEPATPAPEVTTEGPEEPATPAPEVTTEGPEEPATPEPEITTEEPTEPVDPDAPKDPADPDLLEGNTVGRSVATTFNFGNGTAINLWFWADSFSDGFNAFFAKATKDTGRHYEVYTEAGQLKLYAPAANGGNPISLHLNMHEYTGQWHMMTLVHVDNSILVYMDGVHCYSAAGNFELEVGEDLLYIGQIVEGGMEFNGRIVGGELMDRAPASEEIGGLYESVMGKRSETEEMPPALEGNDVGKSLQTDFAFSNGTTIDLWFNVKGFADFSVLVAKSTKDTNRHFEIYCQGSSLMLYAPAANNNNPIALGLDLAGYVGGWHMLTLVHAEDRIAVYLDGALLHTVDAAFTLEAGEDTLYYGQLVEGIFGFNGTIVGGELLNEALTAEAITARYQTVMG